MAGAKRQVWLAGGLGGLPSGRALLRLKPSRRCESMGHHERYAKPQRLVNALRARLLGGGVTGAEPPLRG